MVQSVLPRRLLAVAIAASAAAQNTNTTVSFYNVGACGAVGAVKFDFANDDDICPSSYLNGDRCHVPGPYGREVYVSFMGSLNHLDITLLNPSDDDANLTSPTRIYLAPSQRRNHVGASVRPGTLATGCNFGFSVESIDASTFDIAPRYFRSIFRHSALDVGAMRVVSNGDSTIATLSEGDAYSLDQLLVTPEDMPVPVGISFASPVSGAAAQSDASERLWGSTCQLTSSAFVLFGRPPALPLQVLRLDGAGLDECVYTEATTGKFSAEVAFYNTVATAQKFTFAFGLSPFLPYSSLGTSDALAWTDKSATTATQPGELWVKVVQAGSGNVRVLSQRVPFNVQQRNLIGVSLSPDGTSVQLDLLQADSSAVAPSHFRLIFAHAALTLPEATIYGNDDLELMTVPAGAQGSLDHPLLPPHQAGRLLKLSFRMSDQASYSSLIDLSTLCDGAAYAIVLVGTLDRLDAYDPVLVQVGGTPSACSLSTAAVSSGASASLALVSMAPQPGASARFEFGGTLLSLNRRSVPLPFRASTVTDVPVGDFFMRLLEPDPPYKPLTSVLALTIHPQSRNVMVARATAGGGGATQGLSWRILDLGTDSAAIDALSTRILLLNALDDANGNGVTVHADISGSVDQMIYLPASGMAALSFPADGGAAVSFTQATGGGALGSSVDLPFGEACAQSVQLVAIGGVLNPTDGSDSEGTAHVDAADGYCRLVVPIIPERLVLQGATTQPPATTSTLDIFGPGGPGDGGIFGSPAACSARLAAQRSGGLLTLALLSMACILLR